MTRSKSTLLWPLVAVVVIAWFCWVQANQAKYDHSSPLSEFIAQRHR